MAYLAVLFYFFLLLTQVTVWVPFFMGVAWSEYTLLFAFCLLLVTESSNGRFGQVMKLPQTLFFLGFIFCSIARLTYMGKSHALGVVGYKLIKYFVTYLVVVLALDSVVKVKWAMIFLIIIGLWLANNTIEQYQTGLDIAQQTLNWRGGVRWVGFFDGSNGYCLLFVVLLAYALGLLWFRQNMIFKLLGLVSVPLFVGVIFLTGSRGGYLALLAVLISYLYIKFQKRINLKIFIVLALGLVVLLVAVKPTEEGRGMGESSSSERIELFHHGLQAIKNQPLLGVGSGEFYRHNPIHKQAHNIWLQQMAETGVFGGTLFVLMFYAALKGNARYLFVCDQGSDDFSVGVQVLIGTIGFFSCAFFLTVVWEMPYLMLAMSTALPFLQGEKNSISLKEYGVVALINLILLLLVYLLVQLFFIVF